jgi:hypothetical protein
MKTFKICTVLAFMMAITSVSIAQDKTETFKVSGNCGMCKSKIEKAAKEAGAKTANWDADKQEITVTYKSSATNTAKIQQKIASVGYDNAGFKASVDAYNKLHGCCKYEREEGTTATKAACCNESEKCSHNPDGHHAKAECCKDGKCTKEGHNGKDCCKKDNHGKMDCCKDGKCTKEGHSGVDCCKKAEQ